MPVADLIRQVGISEQTFYRWKRQYASMQSDQVRMDSGRPGKLTDNGYVDTFNGSLRDECLNVHWFVLSS